MGPLCVARRYGCHCCMVTLKFVRCGEDTDGARYVVKRRGSGDSRWRSGEDRNEEKTGMEEMLDQP